MQLCPPACPSPNVCLGMVSPLQIQRQTPKNRKDGGVWVKAGLIMFKIMLGLARDKGCYTDPRCGFNTPENGGGEIHSIQTGSEFGLSLPLSGSQDPRIPFGSQNILSWKLQ